MKIYFKTFNNTIHLYLLNSISDLFEDAIFLGVLNAPKTKIIIEYKNKTHTFCSKKILCRYLKPVSDNIGLLYRYICLKTQLNVLNTYVKNNCYILSVIS